MCSLIIVYHSLWFMVKNYDHFMMVLGFNNSPIDCFIIHPHWNEKSQVERMTFRIQSLLYITIFLGFLMKVKTLNSSVDIDLTYIFSSIYCQGSRHFNVQNNINYLFNND